MPLYDYRCSACGQVREHRQKISDEPLKECPDCGGEYKRIITSVGVIFKGSGFHVNDYRGGGGKPPDKPGGDDKPSGEKKDAPSSTSSDSGSGATSGSGSDSKSDTKTSESSSSSEGSQGKVA